MASTFKDNANLVRETLSAGHIKPLRKTEASNGARTGWIWTLRPEHGGSRMPKRPRVLDPVTC